MKNKISIASIYLAAAILYITGPNSIFLVCPVEEKPMKCHWSVLAVTGAAIILIGIAAIYVFTKTAREQVLLSVLAVINNAVIFSYPSIFIGGCGMKTMPCQTTTFPSYYVISIIVILVTAINVIFLIYKNKGKAE